MDKKTVLLLIASDGYQPLEYGEPKRILEAAGHEVITVGDKLGAAQAAYDNSSIHVDLTLDNVGVEDGDALYLIGGPGALEHLDNDNKTIENIYKILKNNGYFYVCVPNSYRNIWVFLWPVYFYFDRKVGHKKHYSSKDIINKMEKNKLFKLEKIYYNGHLIKLWQLFLEKINLIDDKYWWLLEKKDINKNPSGMQLNAIFKKNL